MSERTKISSLKQGDRFAFRCEMYEFITDVNGMAVCKNLETKRYMYTSLETEVTIEVENKTDCGGWIMKRFMRNI